MIRVEKSKEIPQSLICTKAYNGEDVKNRLISDQHGKCYMCERKLVTDFEIEHLKSQHNSPSLVTDWNNLFLSCKYCNDSKSDKYDDIIEPDKCNVEVLIEQRLDYENKRAVFVTTVSQPDNSVKRTVSLLDKLYNSTIRTIKQERFFEYTLSKINEFNLLVLKYLNDRTNVNKQLIQESLDIENELLGFKYWIIKSNTTLYAEFAQCMLWNKA